MLTPDGDFDRGHRRLYDAYAYRNATLVYGAHMARQFDISSRGLGFVLSMQDESSGGFANDRDPDGSLGDVMDLPYTCGCGLACIALGRLDAARQRLPVPGAGLESEQSRRIRTPVLLLLAAAAEPSSPITTSKTSSGTSSSHRNQAAHSAGPWAGSRPRFSAGCSWSIPIPTTSRWRATFSSSLSKARRNQFEFPQVCKSGWGASLLFQVTGEAAIRRLGRQAGPLVRRHPDPRRLLGLRPRPHGGTHTGTDGRVRGARRHHHRLPRKPPLMRTTSAVLVAPESIELHEVSRSHDRRRRRPATDGAGRDLRKRRLALGSATPP